MYKVTFAFEDGNVVETFANTGDNLLEIAMSSAAKERRAGFKEDPSYQ